MVHVHVPEHYACRFFTLFFKANTCAEINSFVYFSVQCSRQTNECILACVLQKQTVQCFFCLCVFVMRFIQLCCCMILTAMLTVARFTPLTHVALNILFKTQEIDRKCS